MAFAPFRNGELAGAGPSSRAGHQLPFRKGECAMVATISRDELQKKIAQHDRFTLVETLPEFMYRMGHLPGAVNLPPKHVKDQAAQVLPDKSAEVVVYCASPT